MTGEVVSEPPLPLSPEGLPSPCQEVLWEPKSCSITLHSPAVVFDTPFATEIQYGSPFTSSYKVMPVRLVGLPYF